MDPHLVLLALFGAVVLLTAWLPLALRRLPITLPIVCLGLGALLVWSDLAPVLGVNPLENRLLTERLTEFAVLVALTGAGLKIDRRVSWRGWMTAWRLIGIAMPLTIAGIAVMGWGLLGLPLASAILLGAALAPTDPVMAGDVQVGPPRAGLEDDVRFSLTSEAGLNDGLAFPFVYLAIAIALSVEAGGTPWALHWVSIDVVWRLAAGLVVGWLCGKAIGLLVFRPASAGLSQTGDGIVALGLTCLGYAATEAVHGYGFIGVFVAALTLRGCERESHYHEHLHAFAEQIERLLMMVLLVFFGAAIAEGSIFGAMTWQVAGVGLAILLILRPLCGWLSLIGGPQPPREKAMIAFFGIRGLGSFYYLAFALGQAEFGQADLLWVTVCFVVLVSVLLHGTTVTSAMRHLDRRREASEKTGRQ